MTVPLILRRPRRARRPRTAEPGIVRTRTYLPPRRTWAQRDERPLLLPDLPPGFTPKAEAVTPADPTQPGPDERRVQRLMIAAINRWGWSR